MTVGDELRGCLMAAALIGLVGVAAALWARSKAAPDAPAASFMIGNADVKFCGGGRFLLKVVDGRMNVFCEHAEVGIYVGPEQRPAVLSVNGEVTVDGFAFHADALEYIAHENAARP